MLTDSPDARSVPAFTCDQCGSWVAATREAFRFHERRCKPNGWGKSLIVSPRPKPDRLVMSPGAYKTVTQRLRRGR